MRNISGKSFEIWTSGSGGNVIKRHFLSRALTAPSFGGVEPSEQFLEGVTSNNSMIFFEFGPVIQQGMSLNDIYYLELWRPYCSAD